MTPVDSTSIEAISYDVRARELHVRFLANGVTYIYEDVDEEIYRGLLEAASRGRYVNQVVKTQFAYHLL